jgi:hypothetical protein
MVRGSKQTVTLDHGSSLAQSLRPIAIAGGGRKRLRREARVAHEASVSLGLLMGLQCQRTTA